MEIKFSKQAEELLSKLEKKDEIRAILLKQAQERAMWITGSDIIKYLVTGKVAENMQ
jgi:hypothetical protein